MNKTVKVLSDVVYGIGVVIVVVLGAFALFGSNTAVFPDSMMQYTQKELAFLWLAFGTIPMLAACFAVYFFNALHKSAHKIRNSILVFLPGFVCAVCALVVTGVVVAGIMMNTLFFKL